MNTETNPIDFKTHCQQALTLFLSNNQTSLQQKLSQIYKLQSKQLVNQSLPNTAKKGNKFDYEMNFEEEQPQDGHKKKVIPRAKAQRKNDYCQFCPDNEDLHLLSASNYVYLGLPKRKTFRKYHHFIIAPVDHVQTRVGLDESVAQEIKNYQKCLIQMFDSMNLHAIFIEQFSSNNSHIYMDCLAIPLKKAYDLPFFFKQALENVQGFWTTHKKIIEIKKQKGGIQKQIPKQIKYFYIDFGLGYGYAHAIQDEKFWDRNFCFEIVASALNMESFQVKTTEQYGTDEIQLKKKQFDKNWKSFDWTVLIDQ